MAEPKTIQLDLQNGFLHVTLNRPEQRNAMSLEMVEELISLFNRVESGAFADPLRALILRGAGGHFRAGGDIKDMSQARQRAAAGDDQAYYHFNRLFGTMITRANHLPCPLVAVLEGAVLGGGFGLACISDIALAAKQASFGLPETGLGIIPAQIAPFVVQRIGLTQTRRLALTGIRFDADEAKRLGIVHDSVPADQLDDSLAEALDQIRRCAPQANRITKKLLLAAQSNPLEQVLDTAAEDFSRAVTGPEGMEGTMAFVQKRKPEWAE